MSNTRDINETADVPYVPDGYTVNRSVNERTGEWDVTYTNLATGETRSKPPVGAKRAAKRNGARPASVTRNRNLQGRPPVAYNPNDPRWLRWDIQRLEARGMDRSLREERNLKELRTQLAKVNTEIRARSDAEDRALMERARAKQATSPDTIDTTRATHDEIRSASLKVLDRWDHITPAQGDRIDAMLRSEDPQQASAVGRYLLLTATRSYRSAFEKSIFGAPRGGGSPILSAAEQVAVGKVSSDPEIRAATLSGSFGLAVPAQVNPVIVEASAEPATLAAAVTTVTTVSDVFKGVVAPASTFAWQAEDAVVADDTPVLTQPTVPINTARSLVPISRELDMDYPQAVDNFSAELNRGYADALQAAIANGDGSGKPLGLFPGLLAVGASKVNVTTAGSISVTDLRKAWATLPTRFRANASFVMSEAVLNLIRNLDGAASQVDLIHDRQGTTIFGRPVIATDHAPGVSSTSGAGLVVVSDLAAAYTLAVRVPVTTEVIPQTFDAATGRPIFQAGYFCYARLGGSVTNPAAGIVLGNA